MLIKVKYILYVNALPIGTWLEVIYPFHHIFGRPLANGIACLQYHQSHFCLAESVFRI